MTEQPIEPGVWSDETANRAKNAVRASRENWYCYLD